MKSNPQQNPDKSRNVLVLNCGSSSLKYRMIRMPGEVELAAGEAQRIGPKTAEPARILHKQDGKEETIFAEMPSHAAAFERILPLLESPSCGGIHAIGHRVVHGAGFFRSHTLIGSSEIAALRKTLAIAPLHNPPAVALVEACHHLYPELPQAAVFDTVYHASIPWRASRYALPRKLARRLSLRKYGFHGTSHHYVAQEAAKWLGRPLATLSAVSCHLGSGGASLCAIIQGESVDNTMGYSPLPGLVMSTRSGDIDPALALQITALGPQGFQGLETLLNKKSGVLGLSGTSADIRDILAAVNQGGPRDDQQALTLQVYLWRLRKLLGSYLAVTGRADAVIFTDTIGETVPEVRWAACAGLETFGLALDPVKNSEARNLPCEISSENSRVKVLVIATNEELAIARVIHKLLDKREIKKAVSA